MIAGRCVADIGLSYTVMFVIITNSFFLSFE